MSSEDGDSFSFLLQAKRLASGCVCASLLCTASSMLKSTVYTPKQANIKCIQTKNYTTVISAPRGIYPAPWVSVLPHQGSGCALLGWLETAGLCPYPVSQGS